MIAVPLAVWGAGSITTLTALELGCIVGAAVLGSLTYEGCKYLSEIANEEKDISKKGKRAGKDNDPKSTLPKDKSGNYLPDPKATGSHTTLGEREGRNGGNYTQGATFDENGKFKGRTDVTDHGRPHDHENPHWHPAIGPDQTVSGSHPLPDFRH